jgi:hypothetical protein
MTFEEFWLSGIGNCDALPLIGEIIKDVKIGFNGGGINGGFDSAKGWLHDYFVPPVVSQSMRAITGANGVTALLAGKRPMNRAELQAIKGCIPYNNAIYFNWLLNKKLKTFIEDGDINFGVKY